MSTFKGLFARRPAAALVGSAIPSPPPDRPEAMPTLSDTVARAVAVATDPDATLADFAAVARRDAAVTALLLKRSAAGGFDGPAADVGQAVVRIGLRGCAQLIAGVGLRDAVRGHPPMVRERCEAIFGHSLFVAHLNRRLHLGFRGEEYTGGLLHDIGRVVLAARFPVAAARADPLDFAEGPDRLAGERDRLGTDHCRAGDEFAARSGLPEAVRRVIGGHHEPDRRVIGGHHEPDREWAYRPLVGLVAAADGLTNHMQRTRALRGYDPHACRGYAVLSERWAAAAHERFRGLLPAVLRDTLRDTRGTLRSFAG